MLCRLAQIDSLQAECETLRTTTAAAQAQAQATQPKVLDQDDRIASLEAQLSSAQARALHAQAQARDAQMQLEEYRSTMTSAHVDEVQAMRGENVRLQREVRELQAIKDKYLHMAGMASREDSLVTTALFEFGRDVQRNLLRGALYASSAFGTAGGSGSGSGSGAAPSETTGTAAWLGPGASTAAATGGAKSWLARQRELAASRYGAPS